MADEPEADELLLDQQAPEEGEPPEPKPEEEEQGSDKPGELGEEELEVTFDDGAAPAPGEGETGLVRHLRDQIRERDKELSELRKHRPQRIEVGEKPTLAGCDYDEERYEAERDAWEDRKRQASAAETETQQSDSIAREQWERELQGHSAKRASLKFPDLEEAEATALAALNEVQQAVIVRVADNSAQLMYALGKHPAKLAEVSKITDPLKLAAAVARLEQGVKVVPRRKAPDPEEIASGNAGLTHGKDKTLERLEKEASKPGADRSELIRYKKSKGLL